MYASGVFYAVGEQVSRCLSVLSRIESVRSILPESFSLQIQCELEGLQGRHLLRYPRRVCSAQGRTGKVDGREIRIFCSNNYLNLTSDPRLLAAVQNGLAKWGWGSGASRLISGSTSAHVDLEEQLARFKGSQAVVLFPTGYMANVGVLTALAEQGDILLIDKLCHASIIDAARASRARTRFFAHNDTDKLAALLSRYTSARRTLVVTEGIFSMDGDFGALKEIASLKDQHNAVLVVDDAHGTGVLGKSGRGTAELLGIENLVDITVATLSKAMGSLGGFVCCSAQVAEYLRNRSRSYIYTTAAPPVACLAAGAAIRIIENEPERRQKLAAVSMRLRKGLRRKGFNLGSAEAHIVPVILGPTEVALQVADLLWQRGFLVPAIREPSVPGGQARLRISLMCDHTEQDIDDLIEAMVQIAGELRRRAD